jgi:O-antigen/teichoic acid export membrane protein
MTDSRKVLITDTAGISIKFVTGYALTSLGYGASGILIAYLLDVLFISAVYFLIIIRRFSIRPGSFSYVKTFLKDALVNTPSKYSGHIIFNLSIVLMASFGIASSDVGLFYIALVISVFIGSFASSMAFMVIPASSSSNQDLSSESLRLSTSLISPVVVVMLTGPNLVLSLIGSQYVVAAPLLFILAMGIMPFAISINIISKLNNLNRHKNLLILGLLQLGLFIIFFFLLVPLYGTMGAAYSILISLIGSSLLATKWLEKSSLRHIGVCCLSIIISVLTGYMFNWLVGDYIMHSTIIALSISVAICFVVILIFKNTSTVEISQIFKEVFRRGS